MKIKEGGGMDIRAEFEKQEDVANALKMQWVRWEEKFQDYIPCKVSQEAIRVMHNIRFGWKMWQAAKAQAVPEGFVLVPKVPTQKMLDATINVPIPAVYVDSISGQHKLKVAAYYKAMIEAQEPAND